MRCIFTTKSILLTIVGIILVISILPKSEAAVINECTKAILRKTKAIPYAKMVIDKDGTVLDSDLKLGYTEDIIENTEIQICDSVVLSADNDGKGGPGGYKPPYSGNGSGKVPIDKFDPLGKIGFDYGDCDVIAKKTGFTAEQLKNCRSFAQFLTGLKPGDMGYPGIKGGKLLDLLNKVGAEAVFGSKDQLAQGIKNALAKLSSKFPDLTAINDTVANNLVANLAATLVIEFLSNSSVYYQLNKDYSIEFFISAVGHPARSPSMTTEYTGAFGTKLSIVMNHDIYISFSPKDIPSYLVDLTLGKPLQDIKGLTALGVFVLDIEADIPGKMEARQVNCYWTITGGKAISTCRTK